MKNLRILVKTEYIVLFLLCFLTIYIENYLPALSKFASIGFHAFELILAVLFLLFIVLTIIYQRDKISFSSADICFFLFFTWNIVSIFYSENFRLGLRALFQILLFYLILFYFSNVSIYPRFLKVCLNTFGLLIVLNLILVIYQFFHPTNPEYYYFGVIRPSGLTSGCNGLAFLCLYFISLFFPCAILWRKIYYIPVLLLILMIVFTQTRAALVILFILIVLCLFLFRLGQFFYLFVFFCIAIVAYFLHSFVFLFGHIVEISANIDESLINKIGTLHHRLFIWQIIYFEFIKNYFLGMGLGSTESFLRNLPGSISLDAVHNEYLKIFSDCGIIGLGFFLLWIISLLFSSYRTIKFVRSCNLPRFYLILPSASFFSLIVFTLGCSCHNLIYAHESSAIGFFIVGLNNSVSSVLRRNIYE